MPIRQFVYDRAAFKREDLTMLGEAFSAVMLKAGVTARTDPRAEAIARRIIRAAMDGERDHAAGRHRRGRGIKPHDPP